MLYLSNILIFFDVLFSGLLISILPEGSQEAVASDGSLVEF
jgi:hypothetical protein